MEPLNEVERAMDLAVKLNEFELGASFLAHHGQSIPPEAIELRTFLRRAIIAENALEKSVKLQSHYAGLLNQYDGGERMVFESADDWVKRLFETEWRKP